MAAGAGTRRPRRRAVRALDALDDDGRGHAAAGAHGDQARLRSRVPVRPARCRSASSRGADRVAQRHGAAVDVDLVAVELQVADELLGDDGEASLISNRSMSSSSRPAFFSTRRPRGPGRSASGSGRRPGWRWPPRGRGASDHWPWRRPARPRGWRRRRPRRPTSCRRGDELDVEVGYFCSTRLRKVAPVSSMAMSAMASNEGFSAARPSSVSAAGEFSWSSATEPSSR